jgi:hypothetical protein
MIGLASSLLTLLTPSNRWQTIWNLSNIIIASLQHYRTTSMQLCHISAHSLVSGYALLSQSCEKPLKGVPILACASSDKPFVLKIVDLSVAGMAFLPADIVDSDEL